MIGVILSTVTIGVTAALIYEVQHLRKKIKRMRRDIEILQLLEGPRYMKDKNREVAPLLVDLEKIKNILMIKLDHIGDLVVSLPTLKAFRDVSPHFSIHLLCSKSLREFALNIPYVDHVISVEDILIHGGGVSAAGLRSLKSNSFLKKTVFDLAVNLRPYQDTAFIWRYVRFSLRAEFGPPERARDCFYIPASPFSHVAAEIFNMAYYLLGKKMDKNVEVRVPLAAKEKVDSIIRNEVQRPYIVVHPFSGTKARDWGRENFLELARMIKQTYGRYEIVFIGSRGDSLPATGFVNLIGRLSLIETFELLKRAEFFLGNNSGPLHLASLAGAQYIGIFGGEQLPSRWGPIFGRDKGTIIYRDTACSPCERQVCRYGHYACLRGIAPKDVFSEFGKLIDYPADASSRE